jgi:hypothetical protein
MANLAENKVIGFVADWMCRGPIGAPMDASKMPTAQTITIF